MTAQTVTRDEFEDVKELLASAARYAESANEKIDRVATQQEHNTSAIAVLGQRLDQLTVKVDQLTGNVQQLALEVGELRMSLEITAQQAEQDRSQAQIDRAEFRTTVTQLLEVLTRQFNGNGRSEG